MVFCGSWGNRSGSGLDTAGDEITSLSRISTLQVGIELSIHTH